MRFIYTKAFAVFFSTLVIATALIFFHYKGWLDPVQYALMQLPRPVTYVSRKIFEPLKSFFSTAFRLREIANENAALETEVLSLKNNLVAFNSLASENERLKNELEFKKSSKLNLELCEVIAHNPTGIVDTISINCGEDQGAQIGRAVVSKGFLVGRITYVAENFSAVQLITNSNFSIDARISETGTLAIARGSFNSGLVLEQVSQGQSLEKGQLIVTAGVNDKIPKNLIIGEVDEVLSGENDLFKKAAILSSVDFGDLEFVFLVE